jgi:uncharacterized delta-60 repeat protein
MDAGSKDGRGPARSLAWANFAAILVGGAFGVASQLRLSLPLRVVGASAVLCTLLVVWYVQYRPRVGWLVAMGRGQWAATALSLAIATAGLWALLFLPAGSPRRGAVPQRVAGPLAIDPDGGYSIGATGSSDGVPGAVVVRVSADGSLDPTFGENGVAFHRVGVGDTSVDSIFVDGDDEVLVAGTEVPPEGGRTAFLGRLRADGSADRRFFSESEIDPRSKALVLRQTPGRLLFGVTSRLSAAGTVASRGSYVSRNSYALAAVTDTGRLDRSYGQGGLAVGPIACGRVVHIPCRPMQGLLLRPGGDAVVASAAISAMGRNGTPAPMGAGLVFGAPDEGWTTMATDSDGRLLAGGAQAGGLHAEPEFLIARLEGTDSFDPGFGVEGVAEIDLPADGSELGGIAPLADGKILVVGRSATYDRDGLAVARLDAKGRLDPSFGSGGVVTLHPLPVVRPLTRTASTAIAIEADGRIVVAEILAPEAKATTGGALAMVRLTPAGKLDRSFAEDGVATWSLDFRSIRVVRAGDQFLGGMRHDRAVTAETFKYGRLRVLCRGTDAPSFICRRLDRRRRSAIEVQLAGAGRPRVVRRAGSCCVASTAAWRKAEPLASGEEAWIRTRVGALYCTALSAELVCTNRSRHGFLIAASRVKAW